MYRLPALVLAVLALGASPPSTEAPSAGPYLRVLGTAQDGGLPHAACTCERCEAARRDPARRRRIASLGLVLPAGGEVYLVDATPDVREQLDLLADVRRPAVAGVDRAPLAGVLLTHAHFGHYTGLGFFGYEVVHTRRMPVWATPRMAAFLRANGPWSQLVGKENVDLREVPPGTSFRLGPGAGAVSVTALAVPHRDEYSDTVAFLFAGARRKVLYVPDTDAWESWSPPLTEVLAGVDVALVDGTFFSLDELPGRDIREVKHPLIRRTIELLSGRVRDGSLEVYFTHLNHSNPALDPASEAAREIGAAGFAVLADGQELPL